MEPSHVYVNSSAYGFCVFEENELHQRRDELLQFAQNLNENGEEIRGTILLSKEGVNIRLSGLPEAVVQMQKKLASIHPSLANMEFKDSWSGRLTLPRMLVKLKKEVISMGVPEIQPAEQGLAPHVTADEFKEWMDQGKDMVVLDTRNDYEVRLGTFEKAIDLGIKSFRSFPDQAKEKLRELPKEKPIVMFCTGGVRCEKASYVLLNEGHQEVYQLDGGILKYFERVGGAHYRGDCYIFDDRVSLKPTLEEGSAIACFVCRNPLTKDDMTSPDYVPEKSCPYCKHGKTDFRQDGLFHPEAS